MRHFPHPKVANMKKVSRLVVLPDYQGIGLGTVLLNEVAKMYISKGYRFTITTSNPALNHGLNKIKEWHLFYQGRQPRQTTGILGFNNTGSFNRFTFSWEYY